MYLPLLVCKNYNIDAFSKAPNLRQLFQNSFQKTDEICNFMYFGNFMNPEYAGTFAKFNSYFVRNKKKIYDMYHIADVSSDSHYMADIVYPFFVTNEWGKYKQVYKFDAELEFSLADTDIIHIPVRILDRLPYRCFYIEFAEDGIFASHNHGSFVHVIPSENNGYNIIFMRLGTDMLMDILMIPLNQNGEFIIDREQDVITDLVHKDMQEFSMFVLNAIIYLCSENADIQENEITKKTYKPSMTPKNKFSEIRKFDCGIRYGNAIRKIKKETEQKEHVAKQKNISTQPIRPYVRKAHWHHYWTGPGRTVLSLRWIAPVFVGIGDIDTIIHKVSEKPD